MTRWFVIAVVLFGAACGGSPPGDLAEAGVTPDATVMDAQPVPDAEPPDLPPVAVVSDATVLVGSVMTVSGAASFDPEGQPLSYAWSLRSRPPLSTATLDDATGVETSFTADRVGYYVVDLQVSDAEQLSPPATAVMAAVASFDRPVADASADATVLINLPVTVTGASSFDPGGQPLAFDWALVAAPAGSQSTVPNPAAVTFAFWPDLPGTYAFRLVVSNGMQVSLPDVVTVVAEEVVEDVANGRYDPAEVYLAGTVAPGASGRQVLAHWSDPWVAACGIGEDSNVGISGILPDGTFVYTYDQPPQPRRFVCDGCPTWQPGDPWVFGNAANDPAIPTPLVCWHVNGLRMSPTGQLFYLCSGDWYDDTGLPVPGGGWTGPWAVGYQRLALMEDGVLDLDSGVKASFQGFAPDEILAARVADPTGFFVAAETAGTDELWRIDYSGVGTLVGVYPSWPAGIFPRSGPSRIDRQGAHFQLGLESPMTDLILRRTVGGVAEVVYTEADNPPVQIHANEFLITGP